MKCDDIKATARFEPESPFVIVCEGFHEGSLVCELLKHLKITNCDVTFPKKNGRSGIAEVVGLLAGRAWDLHLKRVFIVADAETNAGTSFTDMCKAFVFPFRAPKTPFTVRQDKHFRTGIFILPGAGKNGALEHLLLDAAKEKTPEHLKCIETFEECVGTTGGWSENKKAKLRLACYVATHCQNDPCCGTGFIWRSDNVMLDIASGVFKELGDFLAACAA